MPGPDLLLAFLLATAVFAYMPGPAMLYATAQTLGHGRRSGWWVAMGIHIGGYVHVLAAAFGLALLFQAVPALYLLLKFAGAAYLIFLGVRMILSRLAAASSHIATPPSFWHSIAVEVLNPKTALFFVAFLPQFTDPAVTLPIWAQLLVLGMVVNLMFSSADVACVLMADRLTTILKHRTGSARWLTRLGGGILVSLGVGIATSGV